MTEFDPSVPCTDPGKVLSCFFLFAYVNLRFLFILPFMLVVDVTENNAVLFCLLRITLDVDFTDEWLMALLGVKISSWVERLAVCVIHVRC